MGNNHTDDLVRRLLGMDRQLQPIADQRRALTILSEDLERAGRRVLIGLVSARVETDPRYLPILEQLTRLPGR